MGCCQSTESESPYDSPRTGPINSSANDAAILPHNSSRAGINQASRSQSNGGSSALPSTVARPNHPIRPPTPVPTSPAHVSKWPPPWTRKQLEREREAFFDTRVTGNNEVWKALRLVCDLVRKDEIAEAQGILDALNVTSPMGKITGGKGRSRYREKGGLFDERGQAYDIPPWVVVDPQDILEDEEKDATDGAADDDKEEDDPAGAGGRRRDEKGKGRADDVGEMVLIRARLSDRGTDVSVSVGMKERIAVIIRSIQEQVGTKRVRLMYLGKALDERSTLEQCGWKQGHVVNAMVFEGEESMLSDG